MKKKETIKLISVQTLVMAILFLSGTWVRACGKVAQDGRGEYAVAASFTSNEI
jgi:hypothetical protein